jgi:hypothetical protein
MDSTAKAEKAGFESAERNSLSHATFAIVLSGRLVSHQMMGNAEHPTRDYLASPIVGGLCYGATPFRGGQRTSEVAMPNKKYVQARKKRQFVQPVLQFRREDEPTLDRGTDLIAVSPREH